MDFKIPRLRYRRNLTKMLLIMKLTAILLFSITLQAWSHGYGQNLSVSMHNAPLKKVFRQIQKQTGFGFLYTVELLEKAGRIDIDVKNVSVDEALQLCLQNTRLSYLIVDKTIIIKRKVDVPVRVPAEKEPLPPLKVKGFVTDEEGKPLNGVSVLIKDTNLGTSTDAAGSFQVVIPDGAARVLVFSFVGMEKMEMATDGKTDMKITMRNLLGQQQDIIVVGYGTQKKVNLTGSVSTVKSTELVKASFSNLSQALAGRLPGLITKQTGGEPGNDYANLSIRGFGTALVIVDGVESSLNMIDPNEIESVSILKDASAAVYGARAGNGVILITTKRGVVSKPTITLNTSFAEQGLTLYPRLLDAGRYAELIREGEINSGVTPSSLRFTEEQVQKYKAGTEPGYRGTDWFGAVMDKYSPLQQHNLSFRGGSSIIKYYTFVGYTGQTGMYKSADNQLNRFNVRSNIDAQINRNLSVGLDISIIKSNLKSPNRSQLSLWQDLEEAQPVYPAYLPDPSKIAYTGTVISTIASTTRALGGYADNNNNQLFTTLNLKYVIPGIKGLSVKGLVNYINSSAKSKSWAKQYSMWAYEPQSDTYLEKPGAIPTSLNEGYGQTDNVTGQLFVNYDRVFAEKHNLSVLLLTEMSSFKAQNISAGNNGYISNTIDYLFAGGASSQSSDGSASETGRLSYVGRVNYAFNSKYLLEATMRYDGSPKFPANKRWGFFPSVSAGWKISGESFFKDNITWVDNLKLRGSFSKTGYDGIGAFQYLTGFNFANRYVVDNITRVGLMATGLANPTITWEEMTIYNVGLDFSFLKNKLYGEFNIFYRDRRNILATRILSLPNTFGASLPQENINSQNNRGFELSLGYKNRVRDFSYDISANVSYARAKWDHYEEPAYTDPDDIRINKVSGNWDDRWFGYKSDGLFTSQDEISKYALDQDNQQNGSLKPGDIKYIDQNGDHKLDWKDKVQIGTGGTPQVMFGVNINLAYKNFDLSVLGQGATRYQYMLNLQVANEGNIAEIIYNLRWTEANNNKEAKMPRVYIGGKPNNNFTSDYWLYDASYFRIKALNIGYNLPSSLLNKVSISNLRVYFAGTNLFTFSGMNEFNIDPEAPSGVRAGLSYPQQKIYTVGLNVTF